ncbi:hypothetical protein C0991_001069 [Blastosporella zonata]|nr:hypothetical protein C0991_001069 [Blastosporella zonata]
MGQSSSRQQRIRTLTPGPIQSSASNEPTTQPAEPGEQAPRTPRRSVRKSLLNLVKPNSISGSGSGKKHKRSWRASRRWSKSEPASLPAHDEAEDALSVNGYANEAHDQEVEEVVVTPPPPPPPPDTTTTSDAEPEASTSASGSGTEGEGDTVVVVVDDAENLNSYPTPNLDAPAPHATPASIFDPDSDSNDGEGEPATAPAAQGNTAHAHGFPPPGTLVVVQGVVHTTDVPRPPHAPRSPSPTTATPTVTRASTPHSALNRLSTLLGSRPPSRASFPPSSTTLDRDRDREAEAIPQEHTQDLHADPNLGPISSGSIDVLGTLLSVAAAATAASLLTGTSEPLHLPTSPPPPPPPSLPSSSAASPSTSSFFPSPPATSTTPTSPSSSPSSSPTPADPPTPGLRPASPTPTSGLDATRFRQMWGGIRERLGFRHPSSAAPATAATDAPAPIDELPNLSTDPDPSMNANPTQPANAHPSTPTNALSTDAREHLFGQMARAFNLGLGLATDSVASPSGTNSLSHPSTTHALNSPRSNARNGGSRTRNNGGGDGEEVGEGETEESEEPAEGSFERFLLDLQSDLRIALTSTAASSVPVPAPLVPAAPADEDDSLYADVSNTDDESYEEPFAFTDDEDDIHRTAHHHYHNHNHNQNHNHNHHNHTAQNAVPNPTSASAPTPAPEVDAQGRINWWRLYRFAPITVPSNAQPGQGFPAALVPPSASTFASPASSNAHTHPQTQTQPPLASTSTEPTLPELPFFSDTPSFPPSSPSAQTHPHPQGHTVVVPVIVVGVQSVLANTNITFSPPASASTSNPASTSPTSAATPSFPADEDDLPSTTPGWPSRAADAIRNLRPTRRGNGRAGRTAGPTNGAGSRTFLIYVIGGYYPPNHGILNGGPDTLASLEALLELADLLGHAKPSTATKEEIEKSGLETIKSSQLAQYEAEEKISSNCTERR